MSIFDGTILFFYSIRIIQNVLSYAHLWYVKEHRLDRMWIHLTKTKQGKMILFPPRKYPPITPKTIVLVVIPIICLFLFWNSVSYPVIIRFVCIDFLLFPFTACIELIFILPTQLFHSYQIQKAKSILKNNTFLHVVGITGSYGKTSTKQYISKILEPRYTTLQTSGSINSPIGIAEEVIRSKKDNKSIFIVEMGAYKKGEIAKMTAMTRPDIAVMTAINAQHQDLFGSIENTMDAKYELIAGVSKNGIAIFNADNVYTRRLAKKAFEEKRTVWLYSKYTHEIKDELSWADELFLIDDVSSTVDGVSFVLRWNNASYPIKSTVLGAHQAHNITAAVCVSIACGLSFKEASRLAHTIERSPKTMEKVDGIQGAVFINDTFNNNPDAANAAIHYLAKAKQKKILVFQPMIELGKYAERSHEDVGLEAGKVCNTIILTNNNFYQPFLRGVGRSRKHPDLFVMNAHKAAQYLKKILTKDDMVVFKGKEAEFVLKELKALPSIRT